MAHIGGNQPGFGVVSTNVDVNIGTAHNNKIVDVTAGASDINITLASAATIPNGVRVIVRRNASSTSNVVIGSPISKTLTASAYTCEVICNGTTWIELSRGSSTATPTAHASSHASAGSDPISPLSIGAASTTHASTHADGGSDEVTPLAIGAKVLHGWVDQSATLSFVDGTRILSITPSTSYSFWVNGTKFVKSAPQTVEIANSAGLHYAYESALGVLAETGDVWSITDLTVIPAAIVWWNGSAGRVWNERHGYDRDRAWHRTQHLTRGAAYYTGLGLTLPTTGTPGDFELSSGTIYDEDLPTVIGTQTQCIICYRNTTAAMTFDGTPSNVAYKMNSSNLRYDNAGSLADAGANNYVSVWLYATNDISVPAYAVLGQASHSTLAAVRAEARPTIPMTTAEWVLCYQLIYRNTGTPSLIEVKDYRNVQSGPPINYSAPASVAAQNVLVDATGFTGVLSGKGTAQSALAALDLPVNATATRKYLSQASSGAPTWEEVAAGSASIVNLWMGC